MILSYLKSQIKENNTFEDLTNLLVSWLKYYIVLNSKLKKKFILSL